MVLVDFKTGKPFREIHTENGQVFFLPSTGKIADLEAGVIITCKECGKKEIVNSDSLCDRLKLCIPHTRKAFKARKKRNRASFLLRRLEEEERKSR